MRDFDPVECTQMQSDIHAVKGDMDKLDDDMHEIKVMYENDPARKFFGRWGGALGIAILTSLGTGLYNFGMAASTQDRLKEDQESYVTKEMYKGHKENTNQRFTHVEEDVNEIKQLIKEQNKGITELLRRTPMP